jgi:hypothetical protein
MNREENAALWRKAKVGLASAAANHKRRGCGQTCCWRRGRVGASSAPTLPLEISIDTCNNFKEKAWLRPVGARITSRGDKLPDVYLDPGL